MSEETKLPENRVFGLFFFSVFLVAGGYFSIFENLEVGASFLILAALFLTASLLKPSVLSPLNYFWMKLGWFLGRIVSPIIISIIYFLIIVPYGLVGKLIGRDELRLHSKDENSFWVERKYDQDRTSSFRDQF
jgi:hypothetical protein